MMRNPRFARYWPSAAVVRIATFGSLGRLKAPGTWGSAAGVLLYVVIFYSMNPFWEALLLLAALYFAVGICGEAEKRLKKVDPGEIVLDEVVAMPLCFLGLKPFIGMEYTWAVFVAAFLLFRFFDILKPFGIKRLQKYYGGFGVVADDVAAALATCLILNISIRLIV